LDDAYPFVLTDAVVIKQKIKPTIIVRWTNQHWK
jgi:hypothetical protein